MNYFADADGRRAALTSPTSCATWPRFEVVGWWCWRAGGHLCDESCKSDSVPLFAQSGWAAGVRRNILDGES
jgi:hypothetical protein